MVNWFISDVWKRNPTPFAQVISPSELPKGVVNKGLIKQITLTLQGKEQIHPEIRCSEVACLDVYLQQHDEFVVLVFLSKT